MTTYTDYRDSLQSGDIVAWRENTHNIFSRLIRFFTRSEYTHVGIVLVIKNRVFVAEARTPKVVLTPLSSRIPLYLIPMGMPLSNHAEEVLLKEIGVGRYSILEAIKSYLGANDPKDKKWQCVEFVKYVLEANSYPIVCKDLPTDLVFYLQQKGKTLLYLRESNE